MASKKKSTQKGMERTLEEELKIRPRWKDVLLAIYQGKATGDEFESRKEKTTYNFSLRAKREFTDDHSLAKILKISGEKLTNHLNFLVGRKLIEPLTTEYQDRDWPRPTKTGFDVAVKIEGERSAARTQSILVFVMLLIAVTGAFQFFSGTGAYDPNHLLGVYLVILILIAAGILNIYKKFTKAAVLFLAGLALLGLSYVLSIEPFSDVGLIFIVIIGIFWAAAAAFFTIGKEKWWRG